jgi:hypothetical protein
MSSLASFHRLPESELPGLRAAAASPPHGFWEFLRARGEVVLDFDGSGYVFATLLSYLEEVHGMDLMASRHDELATHLGGRLGSTSIFFTTEHRQRHLAALDPARFAAGDLAAYCQEFTGADEPGAGEAMLAGIAALNTALAAVDRGAVVLLHIG